MADVETDYQNHTATVRFDDSKTGVDAMKEALAKGGFPVSGEPQFLE